MNEAKQNVLHVLAHVTGLGQCRCIGNREWNLHHLGKRLCKIGFTHARRAEQKHVALLQLDVLKGGARLIVLGSRLFGLLGKNTLVVVVDSNRKRHLSLVLADDVLVKPCLDLCRLGQCVKRQRGGAGRAVTRGEIDLLQRLINQLAAGIHTKIADIDAGGRGNQKIDLMLAPTAKGTAADVVLTASLIVVRSHWVVLL